MSFNYGGQRRTIYAPCGWSCSGAVREANGKLALHKRVCEICRGLSFNAEFNQTLGMENGWKGVTAGRNGYSVSNTRTFETSLGVNIITTPQTAPCAVIAVANNLPYPEADAFPLSEEPAKKSRRRRKGKSKGTKEPEEPEV